MTVHTLIPPAQRIRLESPAELIDALGIPFSTQQLEAITAPLEPGVADNDGNVAQRDHARLSTCGMARRRDSRFITQV